MAIRFTISTIDKFRCQSMFLYHYYYLNLFQIQLFILEKMNLSTTNFNRLFKEYLVDLLLID